MIILTKSAAEEAQKIIQENEMPVSAGVRLGVKSGGCSGLNYELDIVEEANGNDRIFEQHGLKLFCDPKSYLYLKGTQVDFLVDSIIEFWFIDHKDKHYTKSDTFDALIRDTFGDSMNAIRSGELDFWQDEPKACLAGLVLLDQFSRNAFRDSSKAFDQDERARTFAKVGIARGFDLSFEPAQRHLFYMPLMHSEYLDDQLMCEACFQRSVKDGNTSASGGFSYATKHRVIIERFSRFPHRNAILNRTSTDEEIEFLKGPGSSF